MAREKQERQSVRAALDKLAVDGGKPVRGQNNPLPNLFPRDIAPDTYELVRQVLDSGFTLNMIGQFERAFAEALGVRHCVTVSNCTSAVHTALAACGIGRGDDVIVSAISDYGSVAGIIWQGAKPVFADVDVRTGNVTADTIATCLTSRTKAVVVVHLLRLGVRH